MQHDSPVLKELLRGRKRLDRGDCRNISITTGGGGVNAIFSDYLRLQSFVISYIATAGGLVYKYWQNVLASAVTRSGRDTPYPLLVAANPLLSARDPLVM